MAKGMSTESVIYVLKFERDAPEGEQTRFYLRQLTFRERARVQDDMIVTEMNTLGPKNVSGSAAMKFKSGTQAKTAIELGLVKIENLKDSAGSLVVYDSNIKQEDRDKVLNMLYPEWVKELAEEILKVSGLMKDEEKN